jgi:hypothetical protein
MQVNHKNGLTHDNSASNLEIVTASTNVRHSFHVLGRKDHGIRAKGAAHGNARFTEDDVREMRRLHRSGMSQVQIAKRFNTHQPVVGRIVNFKAWSHVGY